MNNLMVKIEYLNMLNEIFENYCPKSIIWAYGSRLGTEAHAGSDLDLAVKDFGDKNCSIGELKRILTESNIPFLVDVVEFNNLPKTFQEEITKNYMVIYPKTQK